MRFSLIAILVLRLASLEFLRAQGPETSTEFSQAAKRATSARDANRISEAIVEYRTALRLNPKWTEGWWFLGTFLYQTGEPAQARDAFRVLTELNAKAAPAWGLLGLSEFQAGDFDPALEHVEKALELGMKADAQLGPVLLYHEALLLAKTGDFDRALRRWARFAQSDQSKPELLKAIGITALRRPLLPAEVPANREQLFLSAGAAAALSMAGKLAESERAFQSLLERFGGERNVHYLYGCFLFQSSPEKALAEFRKELQLDANNGAAAAMLAWGLAVQGDATAALPYAKVGVAAEPKSTNARYALGRTLTDLGQPQAALTHLEIAARGDAENLETRITLATAYAKAKRYADAKREREVCLELAAAEKRAP